MHSDATEAALGLLGLTAGSPMDTLPTIPLKRKQPVVSFDPDPVSESIDCICGFHYDDGFSIGCDNCSRWCHAACFGIAEAEVPDEWHCWVCRPRPVDKERAIKLQKSRQKAANELALQQKPRASPGVERKARRASAAAIEGSSHNKRKRRSSITVQHPNEDEHVDIDEPWTHSYVPIEKDIIPHADTRDKLRRVAAHWRGITALHSPPDTPTTTPAVLPPDGDPTSSQISLQPLSPSSSHPSLSAHVNSSVRPPAYAIRAAHPVASSGLVAPYTSTIIPSAAYLSDPLNAYAHLGMPKPFVHLFGPPLDVALDARIAGGQSRFVRSGCRPNTVLRPVLCPRARANSKSPPSEEDTLTFGIFALRDLKAHEEVVLGWEWDDGSVVHHLPALLETPHKFPVHELQHLRYQMTSLLHALSSTFTTCACGAQARDCALIRMAEFVDGQTPPTPAPSPPSGMQAGNETRDREKDKKRTKGNAGKVDLGPLVGVERGFRTRERERMSGGMSGMEMVPSGDAGPSTVAFKKAQSTDGKRSARKTTSRKSVSQQESTRSPTATKDRKGKGRAETLTENYPDQQSPSDDEMTPRANRSRLRDHSTASPTDRRESSPIEDKIPPKMRKRFIHRSLEALRDVSMSDQTPIRRTVSSGDKTSDRMEVDEAASFDARQMPPPPLPPSRSPQPDLTATPSPAPPSPSAPFANLSLLSPIVQGPSSYFPARRSSSPLLSRLELAGNGMFHVRSPETAKVQLQDVLSSSPSIARSDHAPFSPEEPMAASQVILPPEPPPDVQPDPQTELSQTELPEDTPTYASNMISSPVSATVPITPEKVAMAEMPPDLPRSSQIPASTETFPGRPPCTDEAPVHPLPPPKVKLSLKDFALRKKKQREEGEHPSPANVNATLANVQPPSGGIQGAPADGVDKDASIVVDQLVHDGPEKVVPTDRRASVMDGLQNGSSSPKVHPVVDSTDAIRRGDAYPFTFTAVHFPTPKTGSAPLSSLPVDSMESQLSAGSLQAKVELVEERLPDRHTARLHRSLSPPSPTRSRTTEPDEPSPPSSPRLKTLYTPITRQVSQEEGEILSPPPPKAPPLAPRSYTPPTQPRSFHPNTGVPLQRTSPPPARRQPFPFRTQRQTTAARPPSGPRALRSESYVPYPNSYGPPVRGQVGPAPPRGPSADRDRERERWGRERERERSWMSLPRGGRG